MCGHDSKHFPTGSRDGKIVAWQQTDNDSSTSLKNHAALLTIELKKFDSVTAIAFATQFAPNNCDYLAAIGLENGFIHIHPRLTQTGTSYILSIKSKQSNLFERKCLDENVPNELTLDFLLISTVSETMF